LLVIALVAIMRRAIGICIMSCRGHGRRDVVRAIVVSGVAVCHPNLRILIFLKVDIILVIPASGIPSKHLHDQIGDDGETDKTNNCEYSSYSPLVVKEALG